MVFLVIFFPYVMLSKSANFNSTNLKVFVLENIEWFDQAT